MNSSSEQLLIPFRRIFFTLFVILSFLCMLSFDEAHSAESKGGESKAKKIEQEINQVQAQIAEKKRSKKDAEKRERKLIRQKLKMKERQGKANRKEAEKMYKKIMSACRTKRVAFAKKMQEDLKELVGEANFSKGFLESINKRINKADQRIIIAEKKQEKRLAEVKALNERLSLGPKTKEDKARQKRIEKERKKLADRQLRQKRRDAKKSARDRRREEMDIKRKEILRKTKKNLRSNSIRMTENRIKRKKRELTNDLRRQKGENSRQRKYADRELSDSVYRYYREGIDYYKAGSYSIAKEMMMNVEGLHPNYRLTRNYIAHIDKYIAEEKNNASKNKRKEIISQALDSYKKY